MRKLALAMLMLVLVACNNTRSIDAKSCASSETVSELQKIIFQNVRKNYPGSVKYVNDIGNLLKLEISMPVMNDINKDTNKIDCSARIVFRVPSSLYEQFGRNEILTADIGYTIQPSADDNGLVYTVGGFEDISKSIIDAAKQIELADKAEISASIGTKPKNDGYQSDIQESKTANNSSVNLKSDDELQTVKDFYAYLSAGDGFNASKYVIPSKQLSGPLSASSLTSFYGHLSQPLIVLGARHRDDGSVEVLYSYQYKNRPMCHGRANVFTTAIDGREYIARINANGGC